MSTTFSTGRGGDSSKISGRTVRFAAASGRGGAGVPLEQLHKAIERAVTLNGCPSCGLLGIDILIHGGDPDPILGNVEGFNASVR